MKKCILYMRCSSSKQNNQKESITSQKQKIKKFSENLEVERILSELNILDSQERSRKIKLGLKRKKLKK